MDNLFLLLNFPYKHRQHAEHNAAKTRKPIGSFMELVKKLRFVKIAKTDTPLLTLAQEDHVVGLKLAIQQVELHSKGKIKLKSLEEALNEL